jgi:hypothetical protein
LTYFLCWKQDLLADLSRQFDEVLEEALAGARSQPPLEPESYFDRNCQWCFLRARNWDVAAALEQMKACLKWRMDTRPWEVKFTIISITICARLWKCTTSRRHAPLRF